MKYNYDETGAIFSYFLVTLFTLILVPMTLKALFNSTPKKKTCPCKACLSKNASKKKEFLTKSTLLLVLGWILFSFVLYNAFVIKQEEEALWDPYQILGLEDGADEAAIKKAFKRLSLKYHPDKNPNDKEEAEKVFIEITKANKVLTDPEAKALYDEFGHPDGKQAFSLGLALPSYLVDKSNSGLILLVYTIIFGIGFPVLVGKWWRDAQVMSKYQILNATMATFYRDLNQTLGFKGIVGVLIKAQEFEEMNICESETAFAKYERTVLEEFEELAGGKLDLKYIKKSPLYSKRAYQVAVFLAAHLIRLSPNDPKLLNDQKEVIETCGKLASGMLQIVTTRNWLNPTIQIIEFSQLLTQAEVPHQSPFFQLPFITKDILKHFQGKKRDVATIDKFNRLPTTEKRDLLRTLNDEEFDQLLLVAKQIPRIQIAKAQYSVVGEEAIVPSSLVTLSVKFQCAFDGQDLKLDTEIPPPPITKKMFNDDQEDKQEPHCPLYPVSKKPSFSVFLANGSIQRMICITKTTGLEKEHIARLQFQAPPESGQWTFQLYVKSDTFIGIDQLLDVELVVQEANVLPEIIEYADETTDEEYEEEEEVEELKPKKKRVEKGEFDDSSDDEDCKDCGHH